MKAKTLSPKMNYERILISSPADPIFPSLILFRTKYTEAEGFKIAEAYMKVEKTISGGTIQKHLSLFTAAVDEWYNAEIEAYSEDRIQFSGYAPLIGNHEYANELAKLEAHVATFTTNREKKKAAASLI